MRRPYALLFTEDNIERKQDENKHAMSNGRPQRNGLFH